MNLPEQCAVDTFSQEPRHSISAYAPAYADEHSPAKRRKVAADEASYRHQLGAKDGEIRATGGLSQADDLNLALGIFDIGLRHSSPKVLMKLMMLADQRDKSSCSKVASIHEVGYRQSEPRDRCALGDLTTEHIKSHLQKYRSHFKRSSSEFLELYQKTIQPSFYQSNWAEGGTEDHDVGELTTCGNVVQSQDARMAMVHENDFNMEQDLSRESFALQQALIHQQLRLQVTLQQVALASTRTQVALMEGVDNAVQVQTQHEGSSDDLALAGGRGHLPSHLQLDPSSLVAKAVGQLRPCSHGGVAV